MHVRAVLTESNLHKHISKYVCAIVLPQDEMNISKVLSKARL